MGKVLKWTGVALGTVALAAGAAATWIFIGSNAALRRTHAVTVRPVVVPAPTDAAAVARGKHLATTRGCADCHGADFGGATVMDNGAMGRVAGPNLTRGRGGLPADYRDEDYVRAIRHGVARDGRGFFLMPSYEYSGFTDEDMGALVAFLKTVPPVDKPSGGVALGPIARMLVATGKIKLAADQIDHANVKPATVRPAASVEYGRYVAASCTGCHGENLSGGKIEVGPPDWPPAANLTPHPDGRLAKWSEADFIASMRTGRRPDGSEINPVMPRAFGGMDDTELRALWLYLRTLSPRATGVR